MVNYGSTAALLLIATTSISTSSVIAGKQPSSSSRPINEKKKKKQLLLRNNNVQQHHHHRDIKKVERKLDERYTDPFGGTYSSGAASSGDDVEPASLRNDLPCLDIAKDGEDGYGAGCREEAGPVACSSNGECSSQSIGYRQCYDDTPFATNTCVCIIPKPGGGTMCTANYGVSGARPCCNVGKYI